MATAIQKLKMWERTTDFTTSWPSNVLKLFYCLNGEQRSRPLRSDLFSLVQLFVDEFNRMVATKAAPSSWKRTKLPLGTNHRPSWKAPPAPSQRHPRQTGTTGFPEHRWNQGVPVPAEADGGDVKGTARLLPSWCPPTGILSPLLFVDECLHRRIRMSEYSPFESLCLLQRFCSLGPSLRLALCNLQRCLD